MSDCGLLQNMNLTFENENEYIFRITVILVASTGFGGDDQVYGRNGRCLYRNCRQTN